jgi:elongation factor G
VKDIKPTDTHNFALVGHAGEGKTSVGEALLHAAKATDSMGSVTDGSSVLDPLPEEQENHTPVTTSIFAYDHGGKHFTLADTPGNSNFQAEGQVVLRGLDGAVIVVSAGDGARAGTILPVICGSALE